MRKRIDSLNLINLLWISIILINEWIPNIIFTIVCLTCAAITAIYEITLYFQMSDWMEEAVKERLCQRLKYNFAQSLVITLIAISILLH